MSAYFNCSLSRRRLRLFLGGLAASAARALPYEGPPTRGAPRSSTPSSPWCGPPARASPTRPAPSPSDPSPERPGRRSCLVEHESHCPRLELVAEATTRSPRLLPGVVSRSTF